jgi:hypothetical protein
MVGGGEETMALTMVASARPHRLRGGGAGEGCGITLLRIELGWRRSPSSRSFLRPGTRVVVFHLGRPPSLPVHRLALSIVVRPPDKRAISQGGGCRLTTMSPTAVEGSS